MNKKDGWERLHFASLPSTNDFAKEKRAEGRNFIISADSQTGGRGTKGRSFSSKAGGVYLSVLTFYQNFPASNAFQIMATAATAVCKTLQFYGVNACIKWPNDIFVNDLKIAGILIENVFSDNDIRCSVTGVGLNVNNELPQELDGIATTLLQQTGKRFSVKQVRRRLIEQLTASQTMEEYLSFVGYIGKEITLLFGDERIHGTLARVENDGALVAKTAQGERRFTAAEVSLRI